MPVAPLSIPDASQPSCPICDINEKKVISWSDQSKRAAAVALPFLALYKPLNQPLSLISGSMRVIVSLQTLVNSIQKGDTAAISLNLASTCFSTLCVVGSYFAHPLGMLATAGQDIILEMLSLVRHVQEGNNKEALESCGKLMSNVLYLALFLGGGSSPAAVAYLGAQILLGAYYAASEIKKGNYLEGAGHILMSMVRSCELGSHAHSWYLENVPKAPEGAPKAPNVEPKVPGTAPKAPNVEPRPRVPGTAPKAPEGAPKIPNVEPKVPGTAPKAPNVEPRPRVPSTAPKAPEFIELRDKAQYKGSSYGNAVQLERGITLEKAFEIARLNPDIDYFVHHKRHLVLEWPGNAILPRDPSFSPSPQNNPLSLFDRNFYARSFAPNDFVFFSKEGRWLGDTFGGAANTYVKA